MLSPVKLVLSILMALAVLLAPAGMFGAGAAMAMPHHSPAAMPADHCAGEGETDEGEFSAKISCMMACSAIPSTGAPFPDKPALVVQPQSPAMIAFQAGLDPEAETPPPRLA